MSDVILMPGWLQKKEIYKGYNVYDVWGQNLSVKYSSPINYIIGHSIGANLALYNWDENKKLILVNPLLPKRNKISWLWRWLNNITLSDISRAHSPNYKNIRKLMILLSFNPLPTLSRIDRENIVIIKGKYDNHFCDEKSLIFIRSLGFKVVEVNAKHKWSDEYENEIKKILENWKIEENKIYLS